MSRLRSVQARRQLTSRHVRGYTNDWARRSRRAITDYVARHGMVCPGVARLEIAPHPVDGHGSGRLTGNHRTSLQLRRVAGLPLVDNEPIDVMCQGCNTRLGEAERRELEDVPRGKAPANAFRPTEAPSGPWFA